MPDEAPDKRVAFCMASYKGCEAEMVQSHVRMSFAFGRRTNWEFMPFFVSRMRCDVACNRAIGLMNEVEALLPKEQHFTHILWMDDDVALSPNEAIRLVNLVDDEHPAVFALAFYRNKPYIPSLYKYIEWDGSPVTLEHLIEYPENDFLRVSAAGLCAAAFDRDLFRQLKTPYFRWIEGGFKQPSCTPDGWLCHQFLQLGIPVYCHTGIKAKHLGFAEIVDEELALKHKEGWADARHL